MEENIADILKDAFSEVDINFENLHFDDSTKTSRTQHTDEDDDPNDDDSLRIASEKGSTYPLTNVYEQENSSDDSEDDRETASSNTPEINTEATVSPLHGTDNDLFAKNTQKPSFVSTAEDESTQYDIEADASMRELVTEISMLIEEKDDNLEEVVQSQVGPVKELETWNSAKLEISPSLHSYDSWVPSLSDEGSGEGSDEGSESYNTKEETSQPSDGHKNENFTTTKSNSSGDLREFTEEDQEQIEESLAEYPSDLSQSEGEGEGEAEECSKSALDPTFTNRSLIDDESINKTRTSSEEDKNPQEAKRVEFVSIESHIETMDVNTETTSETLGYSASFQNENDKGGHVQGYFKNILSPMEDDGNEGRSGDRRDKEGYIQGYLKNVLSPMGDDGNEGEHGDKRDKEEYLQGYLKNVLSPMGDDGNEGEHGDKRDKEGYLQGYLKNVLSPIGDDGNEGEHGDKRDKEGYLQGYLKYDLSPLDDNGNEGECGDKRDKEGYLQGYFKNDFSPMEDDRNEGGSGDKRDKEGSYQGYLKIDFSPDEDDGNKEESGNERETNDVQDQPDYDSDISSDDHSPSQEESSFLSTFKSELECGSSKQGKCAVEDLGADNDVDYIGTDTEDTDDSNPETLNLGSLYSNSLSYAGPEMDIANTNSSYSFGQSNDESTDINSEFMPTVYQHNTSPLNVLNTLLPKELLSSDLLMAETQLDFPEFDWDLSEEYRHHGGNPEDEDPEELVEELEDHEDKDDQERDWEQEKTRIEAFYKFYGDQVEPEDSNGRSQKVTFCLDNDSSECEPESNSFSPSEEEPDEDLSTAVTTVKHEYHSDSDESQETVFRTEKPKMRPKEQPSLSPELAAKPKRNRCLAVLKSTSALVLATAVGIVSYLWATDNLDWII